VVARTDGVVVRDDGEALPGMGADRFEHQQPRGRARVSTADEQALGYQTVERVEAGTGDHLRRLDSSAAGEDGESREALLLRVVEQSVTPVDGRAPRPLTRGGVAQARTECTEGRAEPFGDLLRRQQCAPSRRQLDRERQTVDAPADLPHGRDVALVEREVGVMRCSEPGTS
jgi:hypothetical protein